MIILEMTAYYKSLGMTLSDALTALYKKYGFYAERMIDTYMEGLDGIEKRRKVMDNLRKNPPKDFAGVSVISIGDFSASKVLNVKTGEYNSISQPKSDVLYFTLENGDKIIVRPSGTEPKIKTYILLHSDDEKELEIKAESYEKDSKKLMEV